MDKHQQWREVFFKRSLKNGLLSMPDRDRISKIMVAMKALQLAEMLEYTGPIAGSVNEAIDMLEKDPCGCPRCGGPRERLPVPGREVAGWPLTCPTITGGCGRQDVALEVDESEDARGPQW